MPRLVPRSLSLASQACATADPLTSVPGLVSRRPGQTGGVLSCSGARGRARCAGSIQGFVLKLVATHPTLPTKTEGPESSAVSALAARAPSICSSSSGGCGALSRPPEERHTWSAPTYTQAEPRTARLEKRSGVSAVATRCACARTAARGARASEGSGPGSGRGRRSRGGPGCEV